MTNEVQIWNFLILPDKIGNPYGVAGLMGNLKAESNLVPTNLQNSGNTKLKLSDEEYTNAVDNGTYSKTRFKTDKYGYGLAQWTSGTRKEKLYSYAKSKKTSIGDLKTQLEFLWEELQQYSAVLSVLKSAKSVKEGSDVVLTKYERPKDQSESVKIKREKLGSDIFKRLSVSDRYVVVKGRSLNIRTGPSAKYPSVAYAYIGDRFKLLETNSETGWHRIERVDHNGILRDDIWITGKYTAIEEGGGDI